MRNPLGLPPYYYWNGYAMMHGLRAFWRKQVNSAKHANLKRWPYCVLQLQIEQMSHILSKCLITITGFLMFIFYQLSHYHSSP